MVISKLNTITVHEMPDIESATSQSIVAWRKRVNALLELPANSKIPVNQRAEYFWSNKSLYKRILNNKDFNEQKFFYLDKGYRGEDPELVALRHNPDNPIHVLCGQCDGVQFALRMYIGTIYARCNCCDIEERIML